MTMLFDEELFDNPHDGGQWSFYDPMAMVTYNSALPPTIHPSLYLNKFPISIFSLKSWTQINGEGFLEVMVENADDVPVDRKPRFVDYLVEIKPSKVEA
ncbi:hypothetical protein MTR_2g048805 [Medicago truncatula]|uniref:Uncharacterized protein n=1 Tax=Medicago truncatula TaxID=3880 RepID=A2Q2M1_MEDTR|nr:hypothetical protein MtrDRAFT_AC151520g41v2 [Medicago truncatula]KEH37824.1 hypothetical protein MTR_2g048805 [Medicago truncatula]